MLGMALSLCLLQYLPTDLSHAIQDWSAMTRPLACAQCASGHSGLGHTRITTSAAAEVAWAVIVNHPERIALRRPSTARRAAY